MSYTVNDGQLPYLDNSWKFVTHRDELVTAVGEISLHIIYINNAFLFLETNNVLYSIF
jgi:hypothetical protein